MWFSRNAHKSREMETQPHRTISYSKCVFVFSGQVITGRADAPCCQWSGCHPRPSWRASSHRKQTHGDDVAPRFLSRPSFLLFSSLLILHRLSLIFQLLCILSSHSLSFCTIRAGDAFNIIPSPSSSSSPFKLIPQTAITGPLQVFRGPAVGDLLAGLHAVSQPQQPGGAGVRDQRWKNGPA